MLKIVFILLPNYLEVIIEKEKLTEYCLNENHPRGKHKARLFKSILGIGITEADYLIEIIKQGLKKNEAIEQDSDEFGKRYSVDIFVEKSNELIRIKTNWIIKLNENKPKLTSCFIKL